MPQETAIRLPSPGSMTASQLRSSSVGRSIVTEITTSLPPTTCTETVSRRGAAAAPLQARSRTAAAARRFILARAGPAQARIVALDFRLHLARAALVDHFPAHHLAGVGEAVARRRELASHAVHALADHHLDDLGALVQHHHFN